MASSIVWKHRKKNADNKANHSRVIDQAAFRKWKADRNPYYGSSICILNMVVGTYFTIVDHEIVERDINADVIFMGGHSGVRAIDSRDGSIFWQFRIYDGDDNNKYYEVTDKDGTTIEEGSLHFTHTDSYDISNTFVYLQGTSTIVFSQSLYNLRPDDMYDYGLGIGRQSIQIYPDTGRLKYRSYNTRKYYWQKPDDHVYGLVTETNSSRVMPSVTEGGKLFLGWDTAIKYVIYDYTNACVASDIENSFCEICTGSGCYDAEFEPYMALSLGAIGDFCIGNDYIAGVYREDITGNQRFGIWDPSNMSALVFSILGGEDWGQGCSTYRDTATPEDWFYVIDGNDLKSYNNLGLRWSYALPASHPDLSSRGAKNFAIWEHEAEEVKTPVIVGVAGQYLFQKPDSDIGAGYEWSLLLLADIGAPVVDPSGNITVVVGNEIRGYDNQGNQLWSLPDSDNFPYASNYVTPAIGTNDEIFVAGDILACYTQVDPDTFEVELTDPENEDTDIAIDKVVSITFSSELNTDSISTASITITDEDDNEYNYNWDYDDAENILTLTLHSQYPTNEEMSVTLSTSLHNTNGVYLTEIYIFKFTTEIRTFPPDPDPLPTPTQATAPALISPDNCKAENVMLTYKVTSPPIPDSKYMLHFQVFTYSDSEGNNLIEYKDTVSNKEDFEWSSDNVTWIPFPEDGFGPGEVTGYFRVIMNVGRGTIVYYKTGIGAEPA